MISFDQYMSACLLSDMQSKQADMDIKFSNMQGKQREIESELKHLIRAIDGTQGDDESKPEDGEASDRKLLKERFMKSLALDKGPLASMPKAAGAWMELIFGIGPPDQRKGKGGSRCRASALSLRHPRRARRPGSGG